MASSIIKDICNGLNRIHMKDLIHRDLKPENILLNFKKLENGETKIIAKITDFGLSAEVPVNVF